MTLFAAYDDLSIYAIGTSPEAAIARARRETREPEARFSTAVIGIDLATRIEEDGWDGHHNTFEVRDGQIVDLTEAREVLRAIGARD